MAPRSLGAENPEARTGPDGTGVRGLRSVSRSGEHASGAFRPRQQAVDPVVDGRGAGLGLLREWPVHVVRAVHGVAIHQHDGKPELVALIERGADFVAGDGDDVGALGAALDLDVARFRQYAVGDRRLRGYVPAAFFRGHVGDDVAARALGGDDGLHGTLLDRGARGGVGGERCGQRLAAQSGQQTGRDHQRAAEHHRRGGNDVSLRFELTFARLQARGQFLGALAQVVGLDARLSAGGDLQIELRGTLAEVVDLAGEPFAHRGVDLVQALDSAAADFFVVFRHQYRGG